MGIANNLSTGFANIVSKAGKQLSVTYFNKSVDDVYDDDVTLSQSGTTLWTSGVVFPIKNTYGSAEANLLEQGKLKTSDQILYVNGSLIFVGDVLQVRVNLGSSTIGMEGYSIIPTGVIAPEVEDQKIYRKAYIRRLTNGSLIGE